MVTLARRLARRSPDIDAARHCSLNLSHPWIYLALGISALKLP